MVAAPESEVGHLNNGFASVKVIDVVFDEGCHLAVQYGEVANALVLERIRPLLLNRLRKASTAQRPSAVQKLLHI